jgi:hypothetical protein
MLMDKREKSVPVEGLSAGVCSNSHPWNPFCPNEDLLTRVMKVVAVVIAAVVVYGIHHIWGSVVVMMIHHPHQLSHKNPQHQRLSSLRNLKLDLLLTLNRFH